MDGEILAKLMLSPLFQGVDEKKLPALLQQAGAYRKRFSQGEKIPFREDGRARLGIIFSGKAKVFSAQDEKTLLNLLTPGSLLGVSTLYGEDSADTVMIAATDTEVLFLDEQDLDPLWEDSAVRRNLVAFLTGRIRFLTEKIASFTAPSAEAGLARFLVQHQDDSNRISSFGSYASLARTLNLGRASLYRALEKLEAEGVICRVGKEILILSQQRLSELI